MDQKTASVLWTFYAQAFEDIFAHRTSDHQAFQACVDLMDERMARNISSSPQKIACQSGCSYCCNMRVSVLPIEARAMVAYLASKGTFRTMDEAWERLTNHQRIVDSMGQSKRDYTNASCPLLLNNRCAVYPVRPIACRHHHSIDVSYCQIPDGKGKEFDLRDMRIHLVDDEYTIAYHALCRALFDHHIGIKVGNLPESMLKVFSEIQNTVDLEKGLLKSRLLQHARRLVRRFRGVAD